MLEGSLSDKIGGPNISSSEQPLVSRALDELAPNHEEGAHNVPSQQYPRNPVELKADHSPSIHHLSVLILLRPWLNLPLTGLASTRVYLFIDIVVVLQQWLEAIKKTFFLMHFSLYKQYFSPTFLSLDPLFPYNHTLHINILVSNKMLLFIN